MPLLGNSVQDVWSGTGFFCLVVAQGTASKRFCSAALVSSNPASQTRAPFAYNVRISVRILLAAPTALGVTARISIFDASGQALNCLQCKDSGLRDNSERAKNSSCVHHSVKTNHQSRKGKKLETIPPLVRGMASKRFSRSVASFTNSC